MPWWWRRFSRSTQVRVPVTRSNLCRHKFGHVICKATSRSSRRKYRFLESFLTLEKLSSSFSFHWKESNCGWCLCNQLCYSFQLSYFCLPPTTSTASSRRPPTTNIFGFPIFSIRSCHSIPLLLLRVRRLGFTIDFSITPNCPLPYFGWSRVPLWF